MTMSAVSQEQHVEHIVDALLREFDGAVPPDQVLAEADRAYRELCDSSRVEAFIPILALRRARTGLQASTRAG